MKRRVYLALFPGLCGALFLTLIPQSTLKAEAPKPAALKGASEEDKNIKELLMELAYFKKAASSYQQTVTGIIRNTYQVRRKNMLAGYEKKIRVEESEERIRRIAAITLFEDFLRRYPNDKRWTPDVIFRLAELYFEKSNDEYLAATEAYDNALSIFDKDKGGEAPEPPKQNYSNTVELHRRLIREWPNYRLIDGAYYLLGFCLSEMGQIDKGNQALLSLVCSNRYRPPLSDDETSSAPGSETTGTTEDTATFNAITYKACVPLFPKSHFNPEAWTRVGEFHFDENQLGPAISAYQKVLDFGPKNNAYYDEALYKLAWTYYRADKFIDAIKNFDRLVVWADQEFSRTGKVGSEMRPEAVQYLGVSFSEEDWDGDTQPDAEAGLARLDSFYKERIGEKHVYEVYRRLGDIYFDTTRYAEANKVYKVILEKWPYRAENPEIQDRIILALERQRNFDEAIKEREEFSRLFGQGTEWEKQNRNNPTAIKKARDFDEQALIQAAIHHHKAGQNLKARGLAMNDGNLLLQASKEYEHAAKAYSAYLDRFPNSKNSYEIRYSYASCLYYSQKFPEAAQVYGEVRDSNLDNRYQEEAAFSATKAYEEYIQEQIRQKKFSEPPLPTAEKAPASLAPLPMPDEFKKWQGALDAYARVLPNSAKSPTLTYKAAEIAYRFQNFDDARKRFADIFYKNCKDPMAITAGQAILVTYQLEKNMDKMEEWATKLKDNKCGGGTEIAKTTAAGAAKLISGIRFKRAQDLMDKKEWDKAAAAFLALVDADPKGQDADKALNNAAVCYENSKRFESATKLYERIWQEYPKSELAGEALWRAAINYQRFFEFSKAVRNFLIIADSARFEKSEHRADAIFNAATLMENDQAYAKAAQLFIRYSDAIGKPKEAAEAFFHAGQIYEKMNDFANMRKTFTDFIKRHGRTPGQGQRVVEIYFKLGQASQKRNQWKEAQKFYQQAKQEYFTQRLAPGSDGAEYVANAAFEIAERKLQTFLQTKMTPDINTLKAQHTRVAKQATALKTEYESIWAFKRVRWTLGAMYRSGVIYEHFARIVGKGFREAPIPAKVKRLGQEAVDIYQQQLDQALDEMVRPLEDKAKELYDSCVKRAKEFAVSNQFTEEALQRLNAFDPVNYPMLKQPKLEEIIE